MLEEFASRVSGSGDTGSLDGPGFLAALLEWVLDSYSAAFERIEQRLEEFDIEAMRGDAEGSLDLSYGFRRHLSRRTGPGRRHPQWKGARPVGGPPMRFTRLWTRTSFSRP